MTHNFILHFYIFRVLIFTTQITSYHHRVGTSTYTEKTTEIRIAVDVCHCLYDEIWCAHKSTNITKSLATVSHLEYHIAYRAYHRVIRVHWSIFLCHVVPTKYDIVADAMPLRLFVIETRLILSRWTPDEPRHWKKVSRMQNCITHYLHSITAGRALRDDGVVI